MNAGVRWLAAFIGIAGALALHAMNYVWWTPPGSPFVAGIQGSIFSPSFRFCSWQSARQTGSRDVSRALRPIFIVAFLLVSGTATLLTVVNRYY